MKEKIEQFEKELESIRAKINQLKGKKSILMERLKNEYNCDTVEQAYDMLAELKESIVVEEANYAKAIADFEKSYQDKLNAVEPKA